jgi:hypothetical protein
MSDEFDELDASEAYREALGRYPDDALRRLIDAVGPWERRPSIRSAPEAIAERLGENATRLRLTSDLEHPSRLVLGLAALIQPATWTIEAIAAVLRSLGRDPAEALRPLAAVGLIAIDDEPALSPRNPLDDLDPSGADGRRVILHPEVLATASGEPPAGPAPPVCGPVRQVRETDGLEAVLRLSALWQRLAEAPLRRTQGGTLFKRDRERLADDPALVGAIDDAIEPLHDPPALWLALGKGVGLVVEDEEADRLIAVPDEFWTEHAVHLPPMIAARWLALETWRETGASPREPRCGVPLPALRAAALLGLATVPESEWVALDDLVAHLAERLGGRAEAAESPPRSSRNDRRDGLRTTLGLILHGPAFVLGLVRAGLADEGRPAVQLTARGRYALGLGPPPAPGPAFDQALYVQPNFEIIAYRQGLNPHLIGQLGRFARWKRFGAAPELALTPEGTYRALEGGLTPAAILDRLTRHSARPLPAGVAESLRTWAGRRERITYHAAATIVEFASPADRDSALAGWPETAGAAPVPVGDRLLMVEDAASVPFQRLRLLGSRDYRQPPEACIEVDADGITLALDPNRSDLFVAAELARFAAELPPERTGALRRRFRVSADSLRRWTEAGLGRAELARWFGRRTGQGLPPSIGLLLAALAPEPPELTLAGAVLLRVAAPEWLDGLEQHPATAALLGERLGPRAALVPEPALPALRQALAELGLVARGDA